jgi:hypothetical protein
MCMSAQASEPEGFPYPVIHGDAAIVPLDEIRRLRAIARHASPEAIEAAEIEESIARHDAWVAAGRPNAERHEDVKRELLADFSL